MDRAALIEKAARAGWEADTADHGLSMHYGWQPPGGDVLNDEYRKQARVMLDAVLPQVATVEELDVLPVGSLLKADDGDVWQLSFHGGWDCLSEDGSGGLRSSAQVVATGPLTVVWEP